MAEISTLDARDRLPLGFSRRVPLGFQLAAGIGSLVALLAIAIVIAVVFVSGLGDGAAELTERDVEYARAIDAAALRAKAMANDERGFLLSGGRDSFRERFERRSVRVLSSFATAARAAEDPEKRAAVSRARTGFELWLVAARDEMEAFKAGDREVAVTEALGPTRDLRYAYEQELRQAQQLGSSAIESGSHSVSTASSQSIAILLIYLAAALAIAALIATWLVRTILRPVYALLAIFAEPGATERLVERYSRVQR